MPWDSPFLASQSSDWDISFTMSVNETSGASEYPGMATDQPWAATPSTSMAKYVARIALPVAAVQEHQAGRCLVGGRIKVDLRPFAVAIGHIEKRLAAGAQRFGPLVSLGDQRRAVLHRRIVVVGGVALGLGKRSPVQPGIESFILSRQDISHDALLRKPKCFVVIHGFDLLHLRCRKGGRVSAFRGSLSSKLNQFLPSDVFEVYPPQRDLEGLEYHGLGSSNRFTDLGKIVEM